MKKSNITKHSLIMGFALIAYFLLVNALGFADKSYLSFFNAVIVGVGIFYVIRDTFKNSTEFNYFEGFIAGVKSGFVATLIFTVFMAIYLFEIDPDLAVELKNQISNSGDRLEFALSFSILLAGLATSVVMPFLILPIYKRSWNTRQTRANQKPLNQR